MLERTESSLHTLAYNTEMCAGIAEARQCPTSTPATVSLFTITSMSTADMELDAVKKTVTRSVQLPGASGSATGHPEQS